jgi:hypothetical protein
VNGFEWLNQLMQWLGRWVPRIVLVKRTHIGVRFTHGGRVTALAPGLYCYWPITTELVLVSTLLRTSEIAAQLCGREVVSVAVSFTVADPLMALQVFNDIFAQLDDRTQIALAAAYEPAKSNTDICSDVRSALEPQFAPHGVAVHSVGVIQRGRVIPLKNLNDWAQHAKAEL